MIVITRIIAGSENCSSRGLREAYRPSSTTRRFHERAQLHNHNVTRREFVDIHHPTPERILNTDGDERPLQGFLVGVMFEEKKAPLSPSSTRFRPLIRLVISRIS